jgi:hypothetical protein
MAPVSKTPAHRRITGRREGNQDIGKLFRI